MVADGRPAGLREKWRADIPVLYDFFLNHHTMWPSLPCRWGAVQAEHKTYAEQRLFLSEQTDGSMPNTLVVTTVAVPLTEGHYGPQARPEHLLEEWDEDGASELVGVHKTIFHPGEVNRIRDLPQHPHIVATHTDAPEVLVWNTETQLDRRPQHEPQSTDDELSSPDLVLTGHEDNAEFALAASNEGPFIISGGRDTNVALWCLEDNVIHATTSLDSESQVPTIPARALFKGHRDTVEDVQFKPGSTDQFCSVGDDHCLLLWDSRSAKAPITRVERAHKKDVHCVDWSPLNDNFILTGSADATARLFDRRKMAVKGHSPPVHTFTNMHYDSVISVQWCPHADGIFATAGDDGVINIVSASAAMSRPQAEKKAMAAQGNTSDDVILKHWGHRDKVSDLHWSPHIPWTLVSCSIDSGKSGGGTIQVWRPTELLQLPKEAAIEKLMCWQSLETPIEG